MTKTVKKLMSTQNLLSEHNRLECVIFIGQILRGLKLGRVWCLQYGLFRTLRYPGFERSRMTTAEHYMYLMKFCALLACQCYCTVLEN